MCTTFNVNEIMSSLGKVLKKWGHKWVVWFDFYQLDLKLNGSFKMSKLSIENLSNFVIVQNSIVAINYRDMNFRRELKERKYFRYTEESQVWV